MTTIKAFEEAKAARAHFLDGEINPTMYWAYEHSKAAENEFINFDEVIWDYDVDPIIETCKANGIERITISSNFSGLISTIAEFEKRGCRLEGLTQVNENFVDMTTGQRKTLPAISIRI